MKTLYVTYLVVFVANVCVGFVQARSTASTAYPESTEPTTVTSSEEQSSAGTTTGAIPSSGASSGLYTSIPDSTISSASSTINEQSTAKTATGIPQTSAQAITLGSSQSTVVKTTQTSTQSTVRDTTLGTTQNQAKETTQGTVQETIQNSLRTTIQDTTIGTTESLTQETTQSSTQTPAQDTTQSLLTTTATTESAPTTPRATTSISTLSSSLSSAASSTSVIETTSGQATTTTKHATSREILQSTSAGQVMSTSSAPEESSASTNVITTTLSQTASTLAMVCNGTWFGDNCQYRCHCKNLFEECWKNQGTCVDSGCPAGWSGPGCLVEARGGTPAIVIVLALLVATLMIYAIFMCCYLNIFVPLKQKQKGQAGPQGAAYDNNAYVMEGVGQEAQVQPGAASTTGKPANEYVEVQLEAPPDAKAKPSAAQQQQPPPAAKAAPPVDLLKGLLPSVSRIKEQATQVNEGDILGEGRFGEITKGYLMQGDRFIDVAYKTLKPNATETEKQGFVGQLGLYSSFKPHQNVIQFYGVCQSENKVYAAFEYAPHGNLRNYLRKNAMPEKSPDLTERRAILTQDRLLKFAMHVANGMHYLHKNQIRHRELSAKNILVGENYIGKIGGLNIDQSQGNPQSDLLVQHKRWLPPECLQTGQYTYQTDVWSYGVLVWEIMSLGGKPYADIATADLTSQIDKGHRLPQPDDCDDNVYGLLRWCWKADPNDRPDFEVLAETMKELVQSAQDIPITKGGDVAGPADYAAVEEVPIDVPAAIQEAIAHDNKAFSTA